MPQFIQLASFLLMLVLSPSSLAVSTLLRPLPALTADQLAVIINDADPLSVKIAAYYQQQRKIPDENMIHIRFDPDYKVMPVDKFEKIKQRVDEETPETVQAYALTWMHPYRVGCMSITTAFAAGYNPKFCAVGCNKTLASPYFNSETSQPYDGYHWRPTMALAGESFAEVKALIDRGVASDYTHPQGTAYLLNTSDKARSTRSVYFPLIQKQLGGFWQVSILDQDVIQNKTDVMFYFTGKTHVKKLRSNHFLPGAIADHLTSAGGILTGSKQMSAIEWIKAGATGSYGAVVEPCNFVQKFPNPALAMFFYLRGNSLIEAYWKSVAWPGQGIFIGEPLARPFAYK